MKIAIFTDNFLPGIGGTENAVLRFATMLSKEHEVAVFAPDYHKEFDDGAYPFKIFRSKSIRVTRNDFWALPKLTCSLKRAINEFKPDVIHTHTLGMMADFANSYAKKNGVPVVCTVHTKYRYCYKNALKARFLVDLVINRIIKRATNADRVCSVSDSMISELESYGLKKPVTVIRNGNNTMPVKEKIYSKTGTLNILYVGLVIDYKNIGFSLDSLRELKKTTSNFKFKIVGRGPHLKKFKRYVKKIGLLDNVEFIGAVTDKQKLNELYAEADILLFTSVFDNDSLVVLEAANAGTPALVLNGTGSAERIKDGVTGFVSEGTTESVAKRILTLMNSRNNIESVGKRANEISVPWESTVKKYLEIYNEEVIKKTNKA